MKVQLHKNNEIRLITFATLRTVGLTTVVDEPGNMVPVS